MNAFLGYVNTQAKKYGARGGRVVALDRIISEISSVSRSMTVKELIELKLITFCDYVFVTPKADNNEIYLSVIGSKTDINMTVSTLHDRLMVSKSKYGERSHDSAKNGADWKSISHAYRVAMQLIELSNHKTLKFPLKYCDAVKALKSGDVDFSVAIELLNTTIQRAEKSFERTENIDIDKQKWMMYCARVYAKEVVATFS